ncbi:MAG: pantoate--beta-alanine ligase [Candidatus Kuenenia sp.]|nr:pantoate--beta-alanine ligase [Candidatus Kuenenia hertensis]
MQIIDSINGIRQKIETFKKNNFQIGFIPTMGALHDGHLSLIREARKENDTIIVSIFINPLQFGENEDFNRYPRPFKNDCLLLSQENADILFCPNREEIYPVSFCTSVTLKKLEDKLCGKSRPGHFSAVATIVLKLFNILKPDIVYFGQKDFQQTVIIKKMVSDLNVDTKIKVLPIVRDKDGLALSSRNAYLGNDERKDALCLFKALTKAKHMINSGITLNREIINAMKSVINDYKSAKVDYISIVDQNNLEDTENAKSGDVIALAVKIGNTRLIDNYIIPFFVFIFYSFTSFLIY